MEDSPWNSNFEVAGFWPAGIIDLPLAFTSVLGKFGTGFIFDVEHRNQVINYIERQEQHHRRVTFQDEYRAFLKKYGIEYDERYVWA